MLSYEYQRGGHGCNMDTLNISVMIIGEYQEETDICMAQETSVRISSAM